MSGHDLHRLFSAELLAAIEELIDERVEAALAVERERAERPPYVSVKEAAALLGISDRLILRMANDGRLPSVTFGRRRLIVRAALESGDGEKAAAREG